MNVQCVQHIPLKGRLHILFNEIIISLQFTYFSKRYTIVKFNHV